MQRSTPVPRRTGFQDGVGAGASLYFITHRTETRLVRPFFSPAARFLFECVRNERVFFFQIALGDKFSHGVIENVRQYSLPELLTFRIVVTL